MAGGKSQQTFENLTMCLQKCGPFSVTDNERFEGWLAAQPRTTMKNAAPFKKLKPTTTNVKSSGPSTGVWTGFQTTPDTELPQLTT